MTGAIRGTIGHEALARSSPSAFASPVAVINEALAASRMGETGRMPREMAVRTSPRTALSLNLHQAECNKGWLVRPDDPLFFHGEGVCWTADGWPTSPRGRVSTSW